MLFFCTVNGVGTGAGVVVIVGTGLQVCRFFEVEDEG